jgi:hypothetical protein
MSVTHVNTKAFVGIHRSEAPGNLMYVLLEDRTAFDLIDLPEGGNARVRHKAIQGTQYIIFQFWIKQFQQIDDAFGLMAYQFKNLAAARESRV